MELLSRMVTAHGGKLLVVCQNKEELADLFYDTCGKTLVRRNGKRYQRGEMPGTFVEVYRRITDGVAYVRIKLSEYFNEPIWNGWGSEAVCSKLGLSSIPYASVAITAENECVDASGMEELWGDFL